MVTILEHFAVMKNIKFRFFITEHSFNWKNVEAKTKTKTAPPPPPKKKEKKTGLDISDYLSLGQDK